MIKLLFFLLSGFTLNLLGSNLQLFSFKLKNPTECIIIQSHNKKKNKASCKSFKMYPVETDQQIDQNDIILVDDTELFINLDKTNLVNPINTAKTQRAETLYVIHKGKALKFKKSEFNWLTKKNIQQYKIKRRQSELLQKEKQGFKLNFFCCR